MWVIFGHVDETYNEPLFWSNELGWVDLSNATRFTHDEMLLFYDRLPSPKANWVLEMNENPNLQPQ